MAESYRGVLHLQAHPSNCPSATPHARQGGQAKTPQPSNKNKVRELIKHERRIEFACEGRRYHDLRRWGDAMEAYNRPISGCNVKARSNERQKFYTTTILNDKLTRRSFSYKHYFYPIPKSGRRGE